MGRDQANARLRVVRTQVVVDHPTAAPSFDDGELLAALRHGDPDAAGALYDRLRPRVVATVRRLLGAGDVDSEDCVQNAFVEIVRSIDRYRGECPLEHWAAQVAANVVYKHIRRRRIERNVFATPTHPSIEADRPEPMSSSRRIVARNLVERVRRTIDAIEPQKAFAFLLHDVLGFDLREVAEITGVSVAAAQKRLVRGRREVHGELAKDPSLAELIVDLEEER